VKQGKEAVLKEAQNQKKNIRGSGLRRIGRSLNMMLLLIFLGMIIKLNT